MAHRVSKLTTAALALFVVAWPAVGLRAEEPAPTCAAVGAKVAQAMGQPLDPESAPSELRLSTKSPEARIEIACPDAHFVKIHDTGNAAGRSAYLSLVAKVAVAVADAGSPDAVKAVARCMSSAVRTPYPVGKVGSTRAREIAKIAYFRGRVELGAFELVCHYETRKIDLLEFDLYPLN